MYRCPKCHATETQEIEGTDQRKCSYCAAQFFPAKEQATKDAAGGGSGALVVLGVVLLAFVAGGIYFVTGSEPPQGPQAQQAVSSAPISSSSATQAPSNITAVAGSTSVSAPEIPVKPEPKPLKADFEFHSATVNSIGGQWFYGMITNKSEVPITKPEVIVVLKDKSGAEIATANGYAAFDLAPGETSPIRIIQREATPYETADFEVHARPLSYKHPAQGLVLAEHKEAHGKYNRISFTGKIRNDGDKPARFCQVFVLLFDKNDKLINLISGYAKTKTLAPGEDARFLLSHAGGNKAPEIGRLEYKVVGSVDSTN